MYTIVLPTVLMLGLLTGCSTSPAAESTQPATVRYDHPIGIRLTMAEGFEEQDRQRIQTCDVCQNRTHEGAVFVAL